ncbi:MAG: hypothetical protein GY711_21050, partial [bacterium]|nr:hypothetical protein [bacterium]
MSSTPALQGRLSSPACLLLLILAGCAPEPETPGAPAQSEAAPAPAIPHPPLDDMEPAVARVLEEQRSKVDALLGRRGATAAERAQAI